MDLTSWLWGNEDEMKQQSLYTPGQQRAEKDYWKNPINQNKTYQAGNDYLQNILSGDPSAFAAFEAPYMRNFEQNIAPGIAERFAGAGTGAGASSSSALYNSLAQAGGNLQQDLAALRSNLMMQAAPQALQYAQQPYSNTLAGLGQRGFENTYQPGSTGVVGGALQGLASGVGQGFGMGMNPFSSLGGFGAKPQAVQPGGLSTMNR